MNFTEWLQLAGKIDGSIAAVAASVALYLPQYSHYALLTVGISGVAGTVLNAIGNYLGTGNVFSGTLPPVATNPAKPPPNPPQ